MKMFTMKKEYTRNTCNLNKIRITSIMLCVIAIILTVCFLVAFVSLFAFAFFFNNMQTIEVNSVNIILAMIIIILMLVIILGLFLYERREKNCSIIEDIDPILGCNSFNKCCKEANNLLRKNKNIKFALVYFTVNRYEYIKEHFDANSIEHTIKYISTVISDSLNNYETYGHISEDSFIAVLNYEEKEQLLEKVDAIISLVNKYDGLHRMNFKLRQSIGIYFIMDHNKLSISEMLDRAVIAQKTNNKTYSDSYVIYDEKIRLEYLKEAEIEASMENALVNNNFKVFLQPKYNIEDDIIDSAEALARWYNPMIEDYEEPINFIPLFETNGFILKLDKYMYIKVCEFLENAMKSTQKISPISVNVSSVTALSPDFLDFYIDTKDKYHIKDGYITLEFTEGLSFESYSLIKKIIPELKNNGFNISIDDFGSGYSSYNILKELPADELKLDKFFIDKGSDNNKDEVLLRMVIKTGKALGMKVTQEGVETIEELEKLKDYGCDVIQGYYYSKPITMEKYIEFINQGTSLMEVVSKSLA
ncbi:MAG: EAL domain-containing protein [Anaerovoracaceae bacterium]